MADLMLKEIDEAIRRDKAEQFWNRNRGTLLLLAIAIIAGTAGGQIYRHYKAKADGEFTIALTQARTELDSGKPEAAAAKFKKLAESNSGEHFAIAATWQTRSELAAGDDAAATTTLKSVIEKSAKGSTWRDLACIWTASLVSSMPKECMSNDDTPLLATKRELIAADALKNGDYTRARAELAALEGSNGATGDQRIRAMQLKLLLPPQEEAKKETTK